MDDDILKQQEHASASHLHRLYVHYDLQGLWARNYLHMLRLLFLPGRTEKKHLQMARRVVGLQAAPPHRCLGYNLFLPELVDVVRKDRRPRALSCSPSATSPDGCAPS